MKKDKSNNKIKICIITILAVLIAFAIASFGVHTAYINGIYDGRGSYESETTDFLVALGNAISEKTEFIKNSSTVLKNVPAEIEEEGIDTYINNLTTLSGAIHTEAVKNVLESYIKDWQDFKDTYASEDNDLITSKFNELKTEATTISGKIREIFDNEIATAIKELKSE